jgi:isoleucyl-tRNA synthetase
MFKWILARLNQLAKFVTERLEAYDVTPAGRAIQEFVTDLSTWYVRRSRERMKSGEEGRDVLRHVLIELSKLMAPFVPFTAEALWGKLQVTSYKLQTSVESVHLVDWPKIEEIDAEVLSTMDAVRKIVETGLAARATAKMPIRQPLQKAKITNYKSQITNEYLEIIKEELNVKEVIVEKGAGELAVELDTILTEELKLEGMKRELIRAVNNLRKEAKLTIQDKIVWELKKSPVMEKLLSTYRDELCMATLASDVRLSDAIGASKKGMVKLGEEEIEFGF